MPAIHDAAVSSANTNGTIASFHDHVVTSGAEILIVAVGVDGTGDRSPYATSSLDGALTPMPSGEVINSASNQGLALFYKLNPTVGTHTIEAGTDFVDASAYTSSISVTFDGLNATPFSDTGSDSGSDTSVSTTVANAASGDLIVDFYVVNGNPTMTIGANQTEKVNANTGGSGGTNYGMSTQAGADGGVMSWTWSGSQRTAQVAFRLPAAAGGDTLMAQGMS